MRYLPSAWRLELLGWLHAYNDEGSVITRFQTHQTGALLAHLALHSRRSHTRDELGDMLWPDADVESMRHRFRQALSALRKQLELPGTPHGSIIAADRWSVRLNMDAVSTDVSAFEETLAQASEQSQPRAKLPLLLRAVELYRGELLPGFYEECFSSDRLRLSDAHADLLGSLAVSLREVGEFPRAIDYAKKLVDLDPLRESAHLELIRLYEAIGERSAAVRQFQLLESVFDDELGEPPSQEATELYEQILKSPKAKPSPVPAIRSGRASGGSSSKKSSPDALRPRLPLQFTHFFGRTEEIKQIADQLGARSARILTIVGMGGVGKTRLAIQAAEACKKVFDDHVFFALLAPIDDPAFIIDAIVKALGIKRIAGMAAADQVAKHLNQFGRVLLVLDNFEHLLGGSEEIRELLGEVPGMQCLITSRHRLNLEGERLLHLAPLAQPDASWTAADLRKTPSAQILVDRAQSVMPDFQITERNAATIANICERLEGIPLAIELAAAWARVLSPTQMLEQLSGRFDILVSRRLDVDERHKTLRAALDYSFSLLRPELQKFFVRLSVFRGGWTLDAAKQVCEEKDAVGALDELIDWSLVVSEGIDDADGSEIRCSMLDTVQQYAGALLGEEERRFLTERRYDYFKLVVDKAEGDLTGAKFKEAAYRLDAESSNIATCLRWCEENRFIEKGIRMAVRLVPYWIIRGEIALARHWLERFTPLDNEKISCATEADLHYGLGRLAVMQGDYEAACRLFGNCAEEFMALKDLAGAARSLNHLGFCEREQGKFEAARKRHEEGLRIGREIGDMASIGMNLANLGTVAAKEGDIHSLIERFEESLGILRPLGDQLLLSTILNNYSFSLLLLNDFEHAEPHIAECLEIVSSLGLQASLTARINKSYIHLLRDEPEPAKALLKDTLLESSRYELRRQLYCCVGQLSMIARRERRYEQSAVLLYAMLSLSQALGLDSDDPYLKMAEEASAEFKQVLSPVAFALANARGRAIPMKELVEFALSSCFES